MSNIERFMYLFMGVLWGHFSSSNSPGILAQELDIHICVNEISFQGVSWLSLTCQTVIGHITWLCVSDSFPKHFQSYRQTWLLKLLLYVLKLKQHCNLPGAHGSTSSSRSVATFAFFRSASGIQWLLTLSSLPLTFPSSFHHLWALSSSLTIRATRTSSPLQLPLPTPLLSSLCNKTSSFHCRRSLVTRTNFSLSLDCLHQKVTSARRLSHFSVIPTNK